MTDQTIIPFRSRQEAKWRAPEGLPLIEARDWEGRAVWVAVAELARTFIPEDYRSLDWFVVQTTRKPVAPGRPGNERCAAAEIAALSLPVILPVEVREVRPRCAGGRRAARGWHAQCLPLFPGYLLVGAAGNDVAGLPLLQAKVTACAHVAGMLGTREEHDHPVRLTRAGFARFADAFNAGWFDETVKDVIRPKDPKIGSLVEIMEGPFMEFTGPVKRFRRQSDSGKSFVSKAFVGLQLLGGEREVEIDVDSLRLVD